MPAFDDNEIDEAVEAAMDAATDTAPSETPPPENEPAPAQASAREMAALEEKIAAERLKAAKESQSETAPRPVPVEDDEPMVSVLAKGREYLDQKLREHAAKPKPVYVPPPMTDSMKAKIAEEQAAGQRAIAKHEAQQASRPPPQRDPSEGFTTPVYRPGDVVPDPTLGVGTGFAAGTKKFDANA